MIKFAITLTWSKIMAFLILGTGFYLAISMLKVDATQIQAAVVFTTTIFVTAGLLGWRQAATTIQSIMPSQKQNVNDDRLSEESSEVPATIV